jgi:DNA-binding NarL/FixJ family response regulator
VETVVTVQQIRANNREPIEDVPQKQPPLDFKFAVQRILGLCNAIATHYPKSRVTVIIQSPDYREDTGAEKAASRAYLGKNDELDMLLGHLGSIDGNGATDRPEVEAELSGPAFVVSEAIEPVWQDDYTHHQEKQPLTKREKETLDLIACGKTNKNIAHIFGISEQTVKCHVGSILRKLNASDRAHSVALALRNGFI